MKNKEIILLREEINHRYNRVLNPENPPPIDFPNFLIEGELIYWKGMIEDEEFQGEDYFLGKIREKRIVKKQGHRINLFYADSSVESEGFKGINLFEHQNGRSFRPILQYENNLIILCSSPKIARRNTTISSLLEKHLNAYI